MNAYIVYDLDHWPTSQLSNFILKLCLFGVTNIAKNSDKNNYVCNGYRIAFDSTGSWSFANGFAGNVVIFRVDSSSSSHTDNLENNFLVLEEGPTDDINRSVGSAEKKFSIKFSKA